MPEPLTSYLALLNSQIGLAWGPLNIIQGHLITAGGHLSAGDPVSAGPYVTAAGQKFYDMWNYIVPTIGFTFRHRIMDCMEWIDDNWGGGGVDMQSILDAMYDAEPLQYHYFIAYIDAYRANMFNLPFYEEFHSDLVKHFS